YISFSVKIHGNIHPFPTQVNAQSVGVAGYRISNLCLIIAVDLTIRGKAVKRIIVCGVTLDVQEIHIAGLHVIQVTNIAIFHFGEIGIDFRLTLEDTTKFVSPDHAHRSAFFHTNSVRSFKSAQRKGLSLIKLGYCILNKTDVSGYTVVKITHFILVSHYYIDSLILHFSDIEERIVGTHGNG